MNEDLKPCLDIESCWDMIPETNGHRVQVFRHKDYNNLLRIIDFKEGTVEFRDTMRIPPLNVIDIYKPLTYMERGEIMGLVLRTIDDAKPIKMPYVHEELKMFVEHHGNTLGLLYYKDNDEEKSIVPIKRFFQIKREPHLYFEEVSWSDFLKASSKEVENNVDQTR